MAPNANAIIFNNLMMKHWTWVAGAAVAFLAVAGGLVGVVRLIGGPLSFHSIDNAWYWGTVLLLATGCVTAMVSLFRDERQLVSRRLALTLLSLRTALVFALFFTLMEPVWSWSQETVRSDRVLIAMDVSESMDTVDLQGTELEKLRWASALGTFGTKESQGRAQRWIDDLQAGQELVWTDPGETSDSEQAAQLGKVRQENLKSQLQEVSSLSRLEMMRRTLQQNSSALLKELERNSQLQFAVLSETLAPIAGKELQEPFISLESIVNRNQSRLVTLAEPVTGESSSVPLAGIVLLSDGHDTTGAPASALVQRLQGLGVPVHTVLVGSEHRPRDLAVLHLDHPESVFLTDQPRIKAILQTSGFEGEPVTVFLQAIDSPDQAPLQQTITPTAAVTEVEFTLPEKQVGRHRFRLWLDVAPQETRDDNNSADFAYNVVDDRARVLVIDGESRWEFRYLGDALSRDPQVSLDQVLFDQPYLGILPKPYFPNQLENVASVPSQQTPFSTYDLVLIGDVSPNDLSSEHWQDLDRYLRDEGGTLVLTAGKQFVPFAYQGTLLEDLLPITEPREIEPNVSNQIGLPESRGFRLSIAPDGEQLPMFQLSQEREESRRIWKELPGHSWGVVGRARGGASVWATGQFPGESPTLESERENALIAQHYVGAGQVIWIGLDSTWRWRFRVGDRYHHRFWGQLVRWAVSFKAGAGNDSIRLRLQNSVIKQGKPALIQTRLDERFLTQFPNLSLEAILTRQGEGRPYTQTVPLQAREGNRLIREATVQQLPAGEYQVQLKLTDAEMTQPLPEVVLIVNEELSQERQDVHANRPLLEQIAAATGGEFLYLNELNRLPELFQKASSNDQVQEDISLSSHWLIFVLFCGLAMTEWTLRKLNGLP
ncbi:MAG TPA: hypothetical protein VNQ76_03715 [Planctomicrobium sp.]|nr:hypothetical protein [Planctomicrobium sp.]